MAKKKAGAKKKVRKKTAGKKAKRKPINHAKAAREELKRNPRSQKKNPLRLTPQQTLFVDCLIGAARMNGTKAAIMAGYSEHSAASQAYDLTHNPLVKAYLHRRQADLKRRLEVTQEKIAREMAVLAFSKPTDFAEWKGNRVVVKSSDEIPDSIVGAIKSIKPLFNKHGRPLGLELKFYDKVAAGKLLAQHLGMLDVQARDESRGIIVEAMEALRAQAVKLGKGQTE